jgi:hypothetical protein
MPSRRVPPPLPIDVGALMAELCKIEPGQNVSNLESVCRRLVQMATEGDVAACKLIFDRPGTWFSGATLILVALRMVMSASLLGVSAACPWCPDSGAVLREPAGSPDRRSLQALRRSKAAQAGLRASSGNIEIFGHFAKRF